jgi:hypothetical protein
MPTPIPLEKARLVELEADFETLKSGGKSVFVQFNPESLKLTYANQVQQPPGSGDSSGPPDIQFVGAGSSKLSLLLWFDVTAPLEPRALPEAERGAGRVDDVRKLTQEVAFFITPRQVQGQRSRYVPPALAFLWGSFQFNGMVDNLEESLEFFSPEGKPLRAALSLSMSQPRITAFRFAQPAGRAAASAGRPRPAADAAGAGTSPLTPAPAGATLQSVAAAAGLGADWKAVAAANGIDNPRQLAPGQLLDLAAHRTPGR